MAVTSVQTLETPRRLSRKTSEGLTGYLFVLPACLIIAVFGLFPIGYALYMSLFRRRVEAGRFVGLENYSRILGDWWGALAFFGGLLLVLAAHWLWTDAFLRSGKQAVWRVVGAVVLLGAGVSVALGWNLMMAASKNKDFLEGLVRTVFYGFASIPVQIALALIIAYLLFQKIKGQELFRMLYFLPYVTPAVAGAVVFQAIFSPREERLANQVAALFGLAPQRWLFERRPLLEVMFGAQIARFNEWLTSVGASWQWEGLWLGPSMALFTIILFGIWTYTGYNVVIFLAGLGNIPVNLYEAAEIDGANHVQKFWNITVPLLSPVTFYLTVLGFIGTFQAFTHLFVMREATNGFVRDSVDTASLVIFDTFYKRNDFTLAAAQSIVLFAVILLLTLMQNRFFGKEARGG